MATTTQKQRAIKYLNRDFESLKRDLIEHLRVYFPDTVQDFNESSAGMFLLELMAFVGDNFSYYLDKKFQESFSESATELKNLFKHAKQLGFKPYGKSAAVGVVDGFIEVPAVRENEKIQPNSNYAGIIKKGAKIKSSTGQTYETLTDADFGKIDINDSKYVQVASRNSTTQEPTTFALRLIDIPVKAGETTSTTFAITSYEAFKKITLPDDDVLEVIQVKDSEGNEWYEVDFLAQDTVFDGVTNTSGDSGDVPSVLKLRAVPYRFITEFDIETNRMSLIFGSGDAETLDGELIPDLGDLAIPLYGKDAFTDVFLDPQNFLKTRTLGLAPTNTTLTVKYRIGGGTATNAGAGELTTVAGASFDVGDSSLPAATVKDVANSFSVTNTRPIQGGKDEPSLEEVRQLIAAHHASQGRVVTNQDFIVRALSMPSKFGSVFRASAKVGPLNKNAVELMVLSKNSDGNAAVPALDLKTNLKKYLSRFRMLTDAIEILDGEIINIGLRFDILTEPRFNKSEVIANCIEALKEHFDIDRWQIYQPINLLDVTKVIADIPGVMSIVKIDVANRVGTYEGRSYSLTPYNIKENTKNGIIYCKETAIFEIKYPNVDIVGTAK